MHWFLWLLKTPSLLLCFVSLQTMRCVPWLFLNTLLFAVLQWIDSDHLPWGDFNRTGLISTLYGSLLCGIGRCFIPPTRPTLLLPWSHSVSSVSISLVLFTKFYKLEYCPWDSWYMFISLSLPPKRHSFSSSCVHSPLPPAPRTLLQFISCIYL